VNIQRATLVRKLFLITLLTIAMLPIKLWAANCDDSNKFYELAKKAGGKQDFETASKWLNKSVARCGQYRNFHLLGRSEQKLGRLEQALSAYKQAEVLAVTDNQRANTVARYGEVLALNGQRQEALTMLQAARSMHSRPVPEWMTVAAKALDMSLSEKPMTKDQIKRGLGTQRFGLMATAMAVKPSVDVRLNFEYNSSNLDDFSRQNITALAEALSDSSYEGTRFKLVGHSDVRGDTAYNRKLSLSRANTVKTMLLQINPELTDRISTAGAGEEQPLYWGDTDEDHRLNRRLQVLIE